MWTQRKFSIFMHIYQGETPIEYSGILFVVNMHCGSHDFSWVINQFANVGQVLMSGAAN